MKLEHIIESIDSLEPLSDVVIEIQDLYLEGHDSIEIDKLVKIIESDVLLSVNILKMANSPIYGFSTKIVSVSQAVTLFGIMQIYGFIMSCQINKKIKASTEIFGCTNERFNDICNIQSALLLQWYSKIDSQNARLLAPLALIMEIGKLVIANEVKLSSYEKEFKQGFQKAKSIKNYEKEIFGLSSHELSAKIFEHWYLDPLYIKILKEFDAQNNIDEDIKTYVDILKVIITAVNLKSVITKESVLKACVMLQKMNLDPDTFAKAALKVKKSYIEELKLRETA